jgi:hypothetical protein
MSQLPFLNSASQGKNSWWRYLITIVVSLVLGTFAAMILIIAVLTVYSIYFRTKASYLIDISSTLSNPIFLLLEVGVGYSISLLFFYLCLRVLHRRSLISLINMEGKISWMNMLKGGSLWTFLLFLTTVLPILIFGGSGYSVTFDPKTFSILLIVCLITFPIQASFEEIFFRGYLMQGFGLLSKKPVIPLLSTSIIFALMHFFNGTDLKMSLIFVSSAFVIGLMFGIIALGENRIETAMGTHIANNLFVALIYNSSDSGLGNLPSVVTVQSSDLYMGVVVTVVLAVIMITSIFWNKKEDLFKIFRLSA